MPTSTADPSTRWCSRTTAALSRTRSRKSARLSRSDDDAAHEFERAHVLQDNWVGRGDLSLMELMDELVHDAIIAIELREARRTAGLVTAYTTTIHRTVKKRKRGRVYPPLTAKETKEAALAKPDIPPNMPDTDDPNEPPPTLEASAVEVHVPFMTMQSKRKKYASGTPADEASIEEMFVEPLPILREYGVSDFFVDEPDIVPPAGPSSSITNPEFDSDGHQYASDGYQYGSDGYYSDAHSYDYD